MARFTREYGLHLLVVEGKGHFPIDMLRVEMASPDTEGDSAAIQDVGVYRRVVLQQFVTHAKQVPYAERWDAFGWNVVWSGSREKYSAWRESQTRKSYDRRGV